MRVQLLPLSERHKGGLALGTRKKPTRPSPERAAGERDGPRDRFPACRRQRKPRQSHSSKAHGPRPGPGEGNRMPNNSPVPLSDATSARSASSSRRRAPLEGTRFTASRHHGRPHRRATTIHSRPSPGAGSSCTSGPLPWLPTPEQEIFFYVDKAFGVFPTEDAHRPAHLTSMSEESHHFIRLPVDQKSTEAASRHPRDQLRRLHLRASGSSLGAQQSLGLSLPFSRKSAVFPKTANFDLLRVPLASTSSGPRHDPASRGVRAALSSSPRRAKPVRPFAKAIFETINQTINGPPHEDTDHSCGLPEPREAFQDPALGSNGRVSRETLSTPSARTCTLPRRAVQSVPRQELRR